MDGVSPVVQGNRLGLSVGVGGGRRGTASTFLGMLDCVNI